LTGRSFAPSNRRGRLGTAKVGKEARNSGKRGAPHAKYLGEKEGQTEKTEKAEG